MSTGAETVNFFAKSEFFGYKVFGALGPRAQGPRDLGAQGPWGPGTLGPCGTGTLGPRDPGAQGPWGPGTLGGPLFNRMPHPCWKIILTCLDNTCGATRSHPKQENYQIKQCVKNKNHETALRLGLGRGRAHA